MATKYYGFDHIHFWVGNALQAAAFYTTKFGFKNIAYKGLETGTRDVVTHVIKQGNITFAFSSPLTNLNTTMNEFLAKHGDGARDVAFNVESCRAAFDFTMANGGEAVMQPQELTDENGTVIIASVKTYGDTIHSFIERKNYNGPFLPGYKERSVIDPLVAELPDVHLDLIDHIVGNQGWNEMLGIEQFYKDKFGFERFWSVDDKQIHTEFSALRSVVMTDPDHVIVMPINEPAEGRKKSQIEEYVDFNAGAGVQHVALRTENIIHAVEQLRRRGVTFLQTPKAYYDDLRKRLSRVDLTVEEDLNTLEALNILVDFDEQGYLLQIFTKPLEDRPTVFFEIIQRHNNNGFGVGNFKALFESIERDQALRGNL